MMPNLAIICGNTEYKNLSKLDCCHDDMLAVQQMLSASNKYNSIIIIENNNSDNFKDKIRSAIDETRNIDELFFYFSGHGAAQDGEFFLCATNFDAKRPNETGLSTEELHTILRIAGANLIVKIIDACNSGSLLIKTDSTWIPQNKDGFRNLIQIASCLNTQSSFTGEPLSIFTEKFRSAVLRKTSGPVYYTDIISTLRDDFLADDLQTPFFVSQHTGRETIVEDGSVFDELRNIIEKKKEIIKDEINSQLDMNQPPTLLSRLQNADAQIANYDKIKIFVDGIFDNLISKVNSEQFSDFFEITAAESSDFDKYTPEKFIVTAMTNEARPDNFVKAIYSRTLKRGSATVAAQIAIPYFGDSLYDEKWTLSLNCRMERVQLKFEFLPKFRTLKKINLTIICVPSLEYCYVFESSTSHMLYDFDNYENNGKKLSQRWWKVRWSTQTDGIIRQITETIQQTVQDQLNDAEDRLTKKK